MIDYITPIYDDWEYPVGVIEYPDGSLRVITNWDIEEHLNK